MFTWFFGRQPSKRATAQRDEPANLPVVGPKQGRRHRDDVPYALPKDLEEGQRLNLQHYVFRYILQGNYAAPLPVTISTILDVGSGTGIWGQEMAQLFPAARVFGLDLEPPQSVSLAASAAAMPTNYHFVQGNILQGLPFPDNMFDYTHQRMLVLALPRERWPAIVRELTRVTRPSGWVELLEIGDEIRPSGPATLQFQRWLTSAMATRGLDVSFTRNLNDLLARCKLHTISGRILDIPLGTWDRRLGTLMEQDLLAAFKALKAPVCAHENISPQAFDSCLEEAYKEWQRMKSTCRFYLAYGRV